MYFAWVTPAVMLLIYRRLGLDPPWRILTVLLLLGFASYFPFLLTGYEFAEVGSVRLPVSISISTSSLIAWYFAVAHYRRARRASSQAPGRPFFDAAFVLLVLASLGAWALGIVQAIDPENPVWFQTALHLFLDGFALGWLLLGVLGLALPGSVDEFTAADAARLHRSWVLLCVGLPSVFLLGIYPDLLPAGVRIVGSAGAIASAGGLLLFVSVRAPTVTSAWRLPLAFLPLLALALIGLSVPQVALWGIASGLRIPYLHLLLLGVVSPGLVAAAVDAWGEGAVPGWRVFHAMVVALLLSLLPVTGLWPSLLGGSWTGWAATFGAAAPAVGVGWMLFVGRRRPWPHRP